MKRLVIALALMGLLATPALAQPKPDKAKPTKAVKKSKPSAVKACEDKKSRPDCAKVIDFGKGDKLSGTRPTGDGDTITTITGGRFGSLIRVRTSFVPEILKSAEAI